MAISLLSDFFPFYIYLLMMKVFDKRMMFFNKMVLFDAAQKEDGYVSNENRIDLLGREWYSSDVLKTFRNSQFLRRSGLLW